MAKTPETNLPQKMAATAAAPAKTPEKNSPQKMAAAPAATAKTPETNSHQKMAATAAARAKTPETVSPQKMEAAPAATETNSPQKMAATAAAAAKAKPLIWDCGSSLYDSFELKSFERQLDSAISSRSLSMPHLPDRRILIPPSDGQQQRQTQVPVPKKTSKISRSFQKLLKSLFRHKQNNSQQSRDGFFVVYDKTGSLTTIPEGPEYDGLSPDIKSLARRTGSERFTATSIGISCA